MSRNLMTTACRFCDHPVRKTEPDRPITRDEAGPYYDRGDDGYGFVGMIVANARCAACGARYLAWVDLSACPGYGDSANGFYGSWEDDAVKALGFYDLSFRSTFNDEPGADDLPRYAVQKRTAWERLGPWEGIQPEVFELTWSDD